MSNTKEIDDFFHIADICSSECEDCQGRKFAFCCIKKEIFEELLDSHLEYVNPNYDNKTILHLFTICNQFCNLFVTIVNKDYHIILVILFPPKFAVYCS